MKKDLYYWACGFSVESDYPHFVVAHDKNGRLKVFRTRTEARKQKGKEQKVEKVSIVYGYFVENYE